MYRQDYILRMFEELSKAIQAMLRFKRESRFKEAEEVVHQSLKKLSETDVDFLLSFEPGQLVIELTGKRSLNHEQLHTIAELLYQYGELRREQQISEDYTMYYARALAIFKFIKRVQTQNFSFELLQRISLLETLCE